MTERAHKVPAQGRHLGVFLFFRCLNCRDKIKMLRLTGQRSEIKFSSMFILFYPDCSLKIQRGHNYFLKFEENP